MEVRRRTVRALERWVSASPKAFTPLLFLFSWSLSRWEYLYRQAPFFFPGFLYLCRGFLILSSLVFLFFLLLLVELCIMGVYTHGITSGIVDSCFSLLLFRHHATFSVVGLRDALPSILES